MNVLAILPLLGLCLVAGGVLYLPFFLWFRWRRSREAGIGREVSFTPAGVVFRLAGGALVAAGVVAPRTFPESTLGGLLNRPHGTLVWYCAGLLMVGAVSAWLNSRGVVLERRPRERDMSVRRLARTAATLSLPLACACAGPRLVFAADDDTRLRALVDAAVRPVLARHDVPGMAVAVTVDGRAHVFCYGVADRRTHAPVTSSTLFEIGSVSKTLTATLAGVALVSGKLSLDDPPSRFVPELKGRPIDRATLLNLGTYTAGGLPLQFPDAVEGDAATLAYFRDWQPAAAPGTRREYSNPSLGLFGLAAGRALGDAGFASAMQTRVFPAFGMAHTFIHVPARAMADYAWGWRDGKPVRAHPGPLDEETYGIRTSASDLIHFVQANIDPSALDETTRRAVEATHVGLFRSGPLVQGLGWEQYPWPVSREWLLGGNSEEMIFDPQPAEPLAGPAPAGPRLFDKTGSTNGFGAYVAFVPARRVGVVILANRNYPIPARVEAGWTILRALAPEPDS